MKLAIGLQPCLPALNEPHGDKVLQKWHIYAATALMPYGLTAEQGEVIDFDDGFVFGRMWFACTAQNALVCIPQIFKVLNGPVLVSLDGGIKPMQAQALRMLFAVLKIDAQLEIEDGGICTTIAVDTADELEKVLTLLAAFEA